MQVASVGHVVTMVTVMGRGSVVNETNASSVLTLCVNIVETAILDSIAVVENQKVNVVKVVWGSPVLLKNSVRGGSVVMMIVSAQKLAVCALKITIAVMVCTAAWDPKKDGIVIPAVLGKVVFHIMVVEGWHLENGAEMRYV